jgi:TRAP-type mannitol/chloroaromatic compound transport system permease small subunit
MKMLAILGGFLLVVVIMYGVNQLINNIRIVDPFDDDEKQKDSNDQKKEDSNAL